MRDSGPPITSDRDHQNENDNTIFDLYSENQTDRSITTQQNHVELIQLRAIATIEST
jgi:hypothetical protein